MKKFPFGKKGKSKKVKGHAKGKALSPEWARSVDKRLDQHAKAINSHAKILKHAGRKWAGR